jgi:hypothetical protein
VTGITAAMEMLAENMWDADLKLHFAAGPTDLPDDLSPSGDGYLPIGDTGSGTAGEYGFLPGVREYLNVYCFGPATGHVVVTVTG